MAATTPKKFIDKIRERYAKERKLVIEKIIDAQKPEAQIDLTSAITRSRIVLGDYVTLDWKHRSQIVSLANRIQNYADDASRTRPLNIIMQAEPGSGKSHFIRCLAKSPRLNSVVAAVTFNMSGMQNVDDLIQPLEAVRNLKVVDKTPILFFDEFDSDESNYALLLPLLWDGELHVGHRDLKTGKIVIILAGSGQNIQKAMADAKAMQKPVEATSKLADLLSRINGGEFSIPDLDEMVGDRDRRADKVCITAALLMDRFGSKLEIVPWSLLHFIGVTKFRYGVRSITHLIELLPVPGEDADTVKVDKLPLASVTKLKDSSLAYHVVNDDGPAAVVAEWEKSIATEAKVRVATKEEEDVPF